MPEFLRTTIDKFTFLVATDRLYTAEGVWALWIQLNAPTRVRLGVSDFIQQHNGDVAFVSLKPTGTAIKAGDEFADIETMKVTISVSSPVAGTIVQVNEAFILNPEAINDDPYGEGWLADIETTNWETDRARLLDATVYLEVMQAQAHEAEIMSPRKVSVIPCSGIGNSLGSVTREAAYELCDTLRPDRTHSALRHKNVLVT
jgi:glycine cleavage system H protein